MTPFEQGFYLELEKIARADKTLIKTLWKPLSKAKGAKPPKIPLKAHSLLEGASKPKWESPVKQLDNAPFKTKLVKHPEPPKPPKRLTESPVSQLNRVAERQKLQAKVPAAPVKAAPEKVPTAPPKTTAAEREAEDLNKVRRRIAKAVGITGAAGVGGLGLMGAAGGAGFAAATLDDRAKRRARAQAQAN
jgi:hypothetical protein